MGFSLAEAARDRGAQVVLVAGPTALEPPTGVQVVRVETTEEMARAVQEAVTEADALFMAAAPADYRPAHASSMKRPRSHRGFNATLKPTPDILAGLKRPRGLVAVGFALESGEGGMDGKAKAAGLARAQQKLRAKRLDYIVLNNAQEPGAGFEVRTNRVTLISREDPPVELPLLDKRAVADRLLDLVEPALA
jgi:phosphopantothenoylcysteine decarboxylase/phosphopantothenate--cysteine ligase